MAENTRELSAPATCTPAQKTDPPALSTPAAQEPSPSKHLFRKMFELKEHRISRPQGEPLPTRLEIRRSPETDRTSITSPRSPEFDSITSLPTPVVGSGEVSPMPSALLAGFVPQRGSGTPTPSKKSYGSLTTRPSFMDTQTGNGSATSRIVSEYGSVNSVDRYSTASMRQGLTAAYSGGQRSPQKRVLSTPLEEKVEGLEREPRSKDEGLTTDAVKLYPGIADDGNRYTWKQVKKLGSGTFSTVVLGECVNACPKELKHVAIKIVELPTTRDTRTRVESSLRRELDVLKALDHPSIIKLLALSAHEDKYCIITPLCEGGDLFELAAKHRALMSPTMIRRIFAETAVAVAYLHKNNIVHRDIKLENVLVNVSLEHLCTVDPFGKLPIITLTDFGLSRTIDPANPLLTTRCGSEDYVPPELLIGLPYDGRQSDSWALGVLLYAIMESRLPFDPPPSKSIRARSRVAHRIARIEWAWSEFSDENHDNWKESEWSEAKWIVDNLLVRREKRITSEKVCETKWVNDCLPKEFKTHLL